MKTLLYSMLFLTSLRAAAFVPGGEPEFKGAENFKRSFPDAGIQRVETKGEVTTVTFCWNGDDMEAWFDSRGNLIAAAELIDSRSLPISARMNLSQDYGEYSILQVREFYHLEKGLSYFVLVKKGDKAMILKVEADGSISVAKKLKRLG